MKSYTGILASDARDENWNHGLELRKILGDFECKELFVCDARKDAFKYAVYGSNQSDFLVVIGGPSSLRDIMSVAKKPILYIPNGVQDLRGYIEEALQNGIEEISIYRFNNECFANYTCGGYITNQLFELKKQKLELQKLKREAVKRFLDVKPASYPLSFHIDGKKIDRDCLGVLVANPDFLAHFPEYPYPLDENTLQVFFIHPANRLEMLIDLKELSKGKIGLDDISYVEHITGKEIEMEIPKAFQKSFYLDGDALLNEQTRISIAPRENVQLIRAKKY